MHILSFKSKSFSAAQAFFINFFLDYLILKNRKFFCRPLTGEVSRTWLPYSHFLPYLIGWSELSASVKALPCSWARIKPLTVSDIAPQTRGQQVSQSFFPLMRTRGRKKISERKIVHYYSRENPTCPTLVYIRTCSIILSILEKNYL